MATTAEILWPKASAKYGAPMGRSGSSGFTDKRGKYHELTAIEGAPCFNLVRVPLDSGGYDPGGAYWGLGRLYGYIGPVSDIRGYVRAKTREEAKAEIRKLYKHARFFR